MPKGKEYYSIAEFAKLAGYVPRSVRQMCIDGIIKANKINFAHTRKWFIRASELEKLKTDSQSTTKAENRDNQETPHKSTDREIAEETVKIDPKKIPEFDKNIYSPLRGDRLTKKKKDTPFLYPFYIKVAGSKIIIDSIQIRTPDSVIPFRFFISESKRV